MATESRYHQQQLELMDSQIWLSASQDQNDVCEEKPEMCPSYTTAGLYIPDLAPPTFSQLQSQGWQHRYDDDVMDMDLLSAWQTDDVPRSDRSLMFGWQPGPVGTWDAQSRDLAAHAHAAQVAHIPTGPGPAVRTDSAFPEPLFKFDKDAIWQVGWTGETSPIVEGVVEPVDSFTDPMNHDAQGSVQVADHVRPAKRRRKVSSPEQQFAEQVTPTAEEPRQAHSSPSSIFGQSPEKPSRRATAATMLPKPEGLAEEDSVQQASALMAGQAQGNTQTIEFAKTVGQPLESAPIPQTPITQTSCQPSPLARVISDQKRSTTASGREDHAVFKTQSTNSKRGHYASEVWEGHKAAIQKLYIDERKPLREVIKIMEKNHNFPATQRMYKARFKQWNLVKNNTEKVVSQILRTKFERDAAGKLSQFTRNGKDVNLQNYLQRKGLTEYDLVDFQVSANALAQVRCRTPPTNVPEDLRLPDRLRFQDTFVMSFKRAFLLWRQEEMDSPFGFQPSVFTWRVSDFPHLSSLIESARLIRSGDGTSGVAALNQAFWAMKSYLASMDATASFYFFFHRQSRPWQEDSRIALAVWKFLAAYASARNHSNHPLFHTFKLMYEVIQREGVVGLRELLTISSSTVADELEKAFGREHWLKDLIWHRCFPEKSKLRHLQLIRDLRDHGPTKKIVNRLY